MPVRLRKDFVYNFSKNGKRVEEEEEETEKDETEEKREAERENEEEGEKPVAEPSSLTSEETHGGNEATNSVENSPNASESGSQPANVSEGERESEESEENSESGSNSGGSEEESEESGQSGGGLGSGGNSQSEQQGSAGSSTASQPENQQNGNEPMENEMGNEEGNGNEGEEEKGETAEKGGEEGNGIGNGERKEGTEGSEGEENIESGETEGEEQEEQGYGSGTKNAVEHEFEDVKPNPHLTRLFYKLVEMLADEEKSMTPMGYGNMVYNVKKLMFRQFERKPLDAYKYYKNRQQVIVILDDSGSMEPYLSLLKSFLDSASKRRDIIVYLAPNGIFTKKIVGGKVVKEISGDDVEQERVKKEISQSGLPVIYVGDFDGANTPIELSWRTRVFWFAPEERYKYFRDHDWVSYPEKDYKGFFARTLTPKDFEMALKEFMRHIHMRRYFYDKYDEDYFYNQEYTEA